MTAKRQHCCAMMTSNANHQCDQHDRFECPDNLIDYRERSNVYGLIVHDGGTSSIAIGYCPWCGAELGDSKRFLDALLSEEDGAGGTPERTIDV